ncbi:MAG: DUF349 domain-containing protein [Bacteroidia bacterium]|nr:MAG: DUF349 domain-containing protein [Bacteroidia bacterium]
MTKKNPIDSVRNEQFDTRGESIENMEKSELIHDDSDIKSESSSLQDEPAEEVVNKEPEPVDEPAEEVVNKEPEPVDEPAEEVVNKEPEPVNEPAEEVVNKEPEPVDEPAEEVAVEIPEKVEKTIEGITEKEPDQELGESKLEDSDTVYEEPEELPDVDYSGRSKGELVETLELLIENRPLTEIRDDVEKIKSIFYKKHKADNEKLRLIFVEEGGVIEDFKAPDDQLEVKMRTLLSNYRGRRTEYSRQMDVEKQDNLSRKYAIIDKIKDLVNREESINKTFQEFRDLQNEWHETGLVPQSAVKNLWETYNHHVELFYDYIKINQELRDLDFKKNLEKKFRLCEKAEELLFEPNPINTFRRLQELHQQWRETGPVPRESRNEVWERFREATSKINKRHHEYFEGQKDEQQKNLDAKTALCEKIDEINGNAIASFKEWETSAKEVIELQKVWRTLGFAPKKYNTAIYQRFREACDLFFQNKRNFYSENKGVQMENLQKKTELCIAAEAIQDS